MAHVGERSHDAKRVGLSLLRRSPSSPGHLACPQAAGAGCAVASHKEWLAHRSESHSGLESEGVVEMQGRPRSRMVRDRGGPQQVRMSVLRRSPCIAAILPRKCGTEGRIGVASDPKQTADTEGRGSWIESPSVVEVLT